MEQNYDIHASLARLEKNLSDLDSCQKEIRNVVAGSARLQEVIDKYSATFGSLSQEIVGFSDTVRAQTAANQRQISDLTGKIMDKVASLKSDLDALESRAETRNSALSRSLTAIAAKCEGISRMASENQSRISTLEKKIDALKLDFGKRLDRNRLITIIIGAVNIILLIILLAK